MLLFCFHKDWLVIKLMQSYVRSCKCLVRAQRLKYFAPHGFQCQSPTQSPGLTSRTQSFHMSVLEVFGSAVFQLKVSLGVHNYVSDVTVYIKKEKTKNKNTYCKFSEDYSFCPYWWKLFNSKDAKTQYQFPKRVQILCSESRHDSMKALKESIKIKSTLPESAIAL